MRTPGWEGRLAQVIEAARTAPYQLGVHDCFRFACAAIEAVTGRDRWPEFAGYVTKRDALALIARHGSHFEAAFDWFFGRTREPWQHARRGDILALATPDGEKHLGVCNGSEVAFLSERGLVFVPISCCLCSWSVE